MLLITVEDKNDYMLKIKNDIKDMLECKFVKDNEDGTKQYMIKSNADVDLRKQIFDILPKKDVTIFELKKAEKSLEDAFITLIDTNTQERQEEAKKEQENKEKVKEEAKKQKEAKKKDKEISKNENNQNKVEKQKQEKQQKNDSQNKKKEKESKSQSKNKKDSKENKKGGKK